jgi:ABC-type transport system involved in multi-copper enzyme maturation permease subunit
MQETLQYSAVPRAQLRWRLARAQTFAIFADAYRELNARRLFWIVLIISGLIVAGFGAVGINAQGFVIFWKEFPSDDINTLILDRGTVYKTLFAQLGIDYWLSWLATILALVSTAGIFPDFISGGSIDLYLSKPIGRLRLFFTKYFAGLLFVALQVLAFCVGGFFVIGIRGGVWEPAIFVAVPLVLLFFSYLFSVMVLLGVLTRSTVASLLLTLLFWIGTFAIYQTESALLHFSLFRQIEVQSYDQQIQADHQKIDRLVAAGAVIPGPQTTQPTFNDRDLQLTRLSMTQAKQDRDQVSDPFATWHHLAYMLDYPLPKTSDTVNLIKRVLGERMHLRRDDEPDDEPPPSSRGMFRNRNLMRRASAEANGQLMARSSTFILGTSLTFEAVVIALAAWIFCRRDF